MLIKNLDSSKLHFKKYSKLGKKGKKNFVWGLFFEKLINWFYISSSQPVTIIK